jgi:hypothetical protein
METTSNRRQAFAQPQSNPATKFLEWKSNDQCFQYFDKAIAESMKEADKEEIALKANVKIKLPFKFLVLDELHTVKGWNEALKGSIISNEVKYISKEVLRVKTYHKDFSGKKTTTNLVDGLYSDIKEKVKVSGAHYVKSIYIMLEDGSLANLQLKGSAVQKWGEFTNKTRNRLADEWVVVAKALEGKKGAVKFFTPEFGFEKSLTKNEGLLADNCFNILEAYLNAYLKPVAVEETVNVLEESEDLDF